jgi:hypothetical protein
MYSFRNIRFTLPIVSTYLHIYSIVYIVLCTTFARLPRAVPLAYVSLSSLLLLFVPPRALGHAQNYRRTAIIAPQPDQAPQSKYWRLRSPVRGSNTCTIQAEYGINHTPCLVTSALTLVETVCCITGTPTYSLQEIPTRYSNPFSPLVNFTL